ncbi:MAG: hypothetical protein LUC43_09110, partial [Burkholderiales bacterium]|nr:hypothetical protein [Burkholderiales bacterium]
MEKRGQSTTLVHAGRDIDKSFGFVNMPIAGGSTVLYKSAADMRKRYQDQLNGNWVDITYGTGGGPTHQAFFKAINELTGAWNLGFFYWISRMCYSVFCLCPSRRPCSCD